jgi:pimeloyl-ACP methyl ester carboxylesterase
MLVGQPAGVCDQRMQDELWVVSTRHLSGTAACTPGPQLRLHRYSGGYWEASTLEGLVQGDSSGITIIYVHGNRVSSAEATVRGRLVYDRLVAYAADETPIRLIVWSWPADHIGGPIRDIRVKAARTQPEGQLLGWFMTQFPPEARISLVGYSYGARIVTGAAHQRALLQRRVLGDAGEEEPVTAPLPIRTALLAPAIDRWWLHPGQPHGLAVTQFDRLLMFYNLADPALRRFSIVETAYHPSAMGYNGIPNVGALGPAASRIRQYEVSRAVGRSHDEYRYLNSPTLVALVAENALWMNSDGI